MGFLELVDKVLGLFIPRAEEHLTPEQIEKEKTDFRNSCKEKWFQEIRNSYFSYSRKKCNRRCDGKRHYINDFKISSQCIIGQPEEDPVRYARIGLHCAFCGELEFFWEIVDIERLQNWIDSGGYKK